MNDHQHLLANAYLDGELTAAEQRAAESDPEVMAGVAELRRLRAALRSATPPAERREAAIATALAELRPPTRAGDALPVATAARASVPRFRRRPRYERMLAVAAAVVAVGLLGVVVINSMGDTDDSSDVAGDAADLTRTSFATEDTGDAALDGEAMTEMATADAAEDVLAATAPESEAGASGDEADDAGGGSGTAEGLVPVVPLDELAEPPDPGSLPDPAALGEYGAELLAGLASGTAPPTPNTWCAFTAGEPTAILGSNVFPTEAGAVELLVAIDEVRRVALGIEPETCQVLVEGALP